MRSMPLAKLGPGEAPIAQAIGMPPKRPIAGERQAFPPPGANPAMPVAIFSKGPSAEKSLLSELGADGGNSPGHEECFARFFSIAGWTMGAFPKCLRHVVALAAMPRCAFL